MSLHGVSGGFTGSNGRLPDLETDASNSWTRGDLENQLIELLARCGEEFEQRAKRRRRWKLIKRVAAGVAGVAFLWFVRKTSPPERDYGEELREVAEGIRVAIRYMGRELAGAIGRPQDAEEMADDLEMAFLEGRMSVNDDGGLEVLIPDPDEDGTYYKLNMSSREDGTMAVWAEGAEGDVVEYNGDRWDDADDNRVGYFGIPVEQRARGTKGSVNFTSGDEGERGDDGGDVGGGAAKGSGAAGGGGGREAREVWVWPAGEAVTGRRRRRAIVVLASGHYSFDERRREPSSVNRDRTPRSSRPRHAPHPATRPCAEEPFLDSFRRDDSSL